VAAWGWHADTQQGCQGLMPHAYREQGTSLARRCQLPPWGNVVHCTACVWTFEIRWQASAWVLNR
jgi:hypothetical protein